MHLPLSSRPFEVVAAAALAVALSASPAVAAGRHGLAADFRAGAPSSSEPTGLFAGIDWEQNPAVPVTTPDDQTRPRVIPFEYSDGYRTRARIHKLASIATLPLFVTEGFLGQSLYDNPTSGKKTAHLAVAAAIGGLFAVNTVTGVWNLVEARKDPHDRKRRLAHGILMLAADAGFLATAATGPSQEEGGSVEGSRSTHRAIAFTSIALATTGYLIMLFGGH
jgi:hypothetical protein